jgi:hypothetical protein
MMGSLQASICIHMQDRDLAFLGVVRSRLVSVFGTSVSTHEVSDSRSSADALGALRSAQDGLAILFAHGTDSYIKRPEENHRFTGQTVETGHFLHRNDLSALKGKAVFCLSCQSNGLAPTALESGASAFVGFDDIPFYQFDSHGTSIDNPTVFNNSQRLIADAIGCTLYAILAGKCSLDESVDYLRLYVMKKAVAFVPWAETRGIRERKEIACMFLRLGTGARYWGRRGSRFERR